MRWTALTLSAALGCGAATAQTYAVDFISSAATAAVMDPTGRVVAGQVSLPPACGGCPPTFGVPAIWWDGRRQLLSLPAGTAYFSFAGISSAGWLAGTAMRFDSTGGPGFVWVPRADGSGFDALALGTLPGLNDAIVTGIDDQHRVYGRAITWMVGEAPFVWSPADGMQDLRLLGYPDEHPVAVSPGGTIATTSLGYRFGDPASVTAVTPPPAGFYPMASALTGAVNDDGMRATFLLSTSGTSSGYRYLGRHTDAAGWQILGGPVVGSQPFDIGTVDPAGAITATLGLNGFRAAGPNGPLQALAGLVSSAYPEASVASAGDQSNGGQVLAQVVIGRSLRLTRLVPVPPCTGNCLRVSALTISGRMISAPGQPGQCVPGASNDVTARLTVTTAGGQPVRGATIRGRFLDDYYLDAPVTLKTSRTGQASTRHQGPACVGAIAFLVDGVDKAGSTLDRSAGRLTAYVIPQPR